MTQQAKITTNHEQIRLWAAARGGQPALVRDRRIRGPEFLLIDLPGGGGKDKLEPLPWEEFFRLFDEQQLAFWYQDSPQADTMSRSFRLVKRP
ncbi:MAG: hypothetical protein HY340_03670 [Candidatus Kerfeldbacteria bacterium]|nr:hypothetical protein [Candidatus Kerfeldbacteria bacterium]